MLSTLVKSSSTFNRVGEKLMSTQRILTLDNLSNIPGSKKLRTRVGRGIGSGHGKNCGYGHQKSRSTPRSFEGGQTPFYKRVAKIGFHNHNERDLQILNVDKIQQFIDMGRLVPKENGLITMRNLLECGIISSCKEGVKLLANNSQDLKSAIHLEVSFASRSAIKAIEEAKGTVTCVHFNRLALRALIKPLKFDILPRRARPSPKIMEYYLDKSVCGYLSPEIQARNLALFGYVTSESESREEFNKVMHMRRHLIRAEKEIARDEARVVMAERIAQSEAEKARNAEDEFFEEKRQEQSARDRARLVEDMLEKRYADRRKR